MEERSPRLTPRRSASVPRQRPELDISELWADCNAEGVVVAAYINVVSQMEPYSLNNALLLNRALMDPGQKSEICCT